MSQEISDGLELKTLSIGTLRDGACDSLLSDPQGYLLRGRQRAMFTSNPLARPEDPVQVLAEVDGRIVGRMNLLRGVVDQGGEHEIFWATGFSVHESMRGRGIGKALVARIQELCHTLGAIGASAMSYPIFERFEWRRADAPRMVQVRRSLPIVRSRLKHRGAAAASSTVLDSALYLRRRVMARRSPLPKQLRVDEVAELEAAWLPSRAGGDLGFPRTAEWIRWVQRQVSGGASDWKNFLVRAGDEPFGYFSVSSKCYPNASRWGYRDLSLATIKDWQAIDRDPESNRSLALLAVEEALKLEVDAVQICPNDPTLVDRLRRRGCFEKGSMPLHLRAASGSELDPDVVANPARWDFRPADGDYFLF